MLRQCRGRATGLSVAAYALATSAAAGPPYVTDDPQPTDLGRWEIYAFAAGTKLPQATEGEAGLDINYGADENLQLTLVLPIAYETNGLYRAGVGDLELAAKYRFLRQKKGNATTDLAVFPAISLPTGARRFSERRATLFLPLWAQKDFGPWSIFGGGGYRIQPGQDVWETGIALTRAVTEHLTLGGELYHRTEEEPGAGSFTGLALGLTYKVSERWSLLASGGPGVQNRDEGRFRVYVSLKADY